MTNFDLLNELEDTFAEVKAGGDFTPLPDGDYLVKIESCELTESKKGQPMVKTVSVVAAGEHEGEKHFNFNMLAGGNNDMLKMNLSNFKRQFGELGIDVDNGLINACEQLENLVGVECELEIKTTKSKKTGKEYTNAFLKLADDNVPF